MQSYSVSQNISHVTVYPCDHNTHNSHAAILSFYLQPQTKLARQSGEGVPERVELALGDWDDVSTICTVLWNFNYTCLAVHNSSHRLSHPPCIMMAKCTRHMTHTHTERVTNNWMAHCHTHTHTHICTWSQ